jgi:hypothetical protein
VHRQDFDFSIKGDLKAKERHSANNTFSQTKTA